MAGLVWACRKLRTWLQSSEHPIVILTDHQSTRGIVNQSSLRTTDLDKLNPRYILASIYLAQYRLDVRHIPGKLNLVPDALSRLPNTDDDEPERMPDANELHDIWMESYFAVTYVELDPDFRQRSRSGQKGSAESA